MDRRSFFKSLALLAGAASVAPSIFIPKFEPVRWKVTQGLGCKLYEVKKWVCVRNPEYSLAPFEQLIITNPGTPFTETLAKMNLSYPFRYKRDDNGQLINVPPFKLIDEKDYKPQKMGWMFHDESIQRIGEMKWKAGEFQQDSEFLDEHLSL